jgi:hypothetical protein
LGLWFAAFAAFAALGASRPAVAAIKVHGAIVDDEYKAVGENRFRSKEDWEKTIRFFKSHYGGKPGYVWINIDTPPKVKAIHIENTHAGRTWEGINIYETNREIYVFVIKAESRSRRK